LKIPASLRQETLYAFYWLGLSVPIVVVTAGLRGVLEAFQKFRLATAIRVPLGVFAYLGPVLVLPFSHHLSAVVAMLVLGRTLAGIAYLWACLYTFPMLRHHFRLQSSSLPTLLRFGGWMTVSNVVGPLMVNFDRFVIGAMVSVSAVAYYAVPYEVVAKLILVPAAVVGVLFPAFSTAHVTDRKRLSLLYASGNRYIFVILFPISLMLVAFAPEALRGWLGSDFAHHSTSLVRLLVIAIFINSLGYVPFAHIQAVGRPDITAKLHLAELPVYACLLFFLIHRIGIDGAAIAWLVRAAIDASVLFVVSIRLLSDRVSITAKWASLLTASAVLLLLAQLHTSLPTRMLLVGATCFLGVPGVWLWILPEKDRNSLRSLSQQIRFSNHDRSQGDISCG
jgi:O-antigen/teichoic acid export membrane protein